MKLLIVTALFAMALAERPKIKDNTRAFLVKISDIPIGSCGGDSYFGLGIMNGTLEKCEEWQKTDPEDMKAYEIWKCKHLRMHGQVKDGKCVCADMWKGSICNDYHGCDPGFSYNGKVCIPNVCKNGGDLAVGSVEIECICPIPWDGRLCERLTCWRKTKFGQDKRFINDVKSCKCGKHYTGENCDVIKTCYNGEEPVDGKCTCLPGFGGEICDRTCPKGQLTYVFMFDS
ncbi:unnamed protein product [Auanema sp. JU1783]|nr:unnamed protein product [Auanema sp. JU1783]